MKNLAYPIRLRFALSSAAAALALVASAAVADTVKTKDGKTYEGTITAEDATSVTIKYKLTATIDDLKVIPRTDIVSVDKKTAEDIAAESVKKMLPTADFLNRQDYLKLIEEGPAKFLATYPASVKYKADVEKVKKTLEDEMLRVRTGERKVDGKWVSSHEMTANDYNIEALKLLRRMEEQIAAEKFREALLTFVELEAAGKFSVNYPPAIDLAKSTLDKYTAQLKQQIKDLPTKLADANKRLVNLVPEEKKKALAEREAARKAHIAKIQEEKKQKLRFTSVSEMDAGSLNEAVKQAELETKRVAALDKAAISETAKAYEDVLKLIGQKKYDEAGLRLDALLKKDKALGADKGVAAKVEEIQRLKEEAAKEARQRELLDRTQPAPTPAPAK